MTPDALAALHARAFTEAPRPWSAAAFAALLGQDAFLLTEARGFALGRAVAGEAELLTLAVDPDARRQGIGRRLLAGFETQARALGASQAFLEVAETNAAARALYAASGYAETGRRAGYYARAAAPPVAAIVLRKPL